MRPHAAARRWLDEILDAIRASELDAAAAIAELPLDLGELCTGFDPNSCPRPAGERGGLDERARADRAAGRRRRARLGARARLGGPRAGSRLATVFAVRQANDIDLAWTEDADQATRPTRRTASTMPSGRDVALFHRRPRPSRRGCRAGDRALARRPFRVPLPRAVGRADRRLRRGRALSTARPSGG